MIKKYSSWLNWLNDNLLFILSTFLIVFIPLFPKIPLFDILPGYIVRIRAEDFLILFTAVVWLRDASKKKFNWNTSFFWFVIAYAVVGLTSIFLSASLLQSVPMELLHIGKSALHFFRYMEYFALFFFVYSSIKNKQHIKIVLVTLAVTLFGVIVYGFGQQYLHFPLYSTMNREYSKGQKLYLQENARPQSTFAGHYDLGAYLVIILPIIFALSIGKWSNSKKSTRATNKLKIILHFLHLSGAWMLVTSGSKTALAAYLVGILIVILFYLQKLKNFKQQLKWGGISLVVVTILVTTAIAIFGQETEAALISIAQQNSIANKIITKIPGLNLIENTNTNSDPTRPEDLYGEGHENKVEITTNENGVITKTIVEQKSTWSENALKYGISMGIRLDTLWPQAIKGLINNPLFGNGYATLTSIDSGQFTEADSTDNNFLRTLGETGILGFITFYGLVIFALKNIYKNSKNDDSLISIISIGLTASIVGLLINATYIDVFAASKVAFTFWALLGLGLKAKKISTKKSENSAALKTVTHLKKHGAFYLAFLLLFFMLHKNPYKSSSLIRDFNTSNKAIESVVATNCFIETGSFSVCRSNGLTLKNNFNLYSVLLVPFLKINSDPATFYFLNISLVIGIFIFIYKLILKIAKDNKPNNKRNLVVFTSLMLTNFIFYLNLSTSSPLTSKNLFILLIITPAAVILLAKALLNFKKKIFIAAQLSLLLAIIFFVTLTSSNIFDEIKTNFRNNKQPYKNWTVERSNIFFEDKLLEGKSGGEYLITVINPYYFDLYKDGDYKLLPASTNQSYFENSQDVWEDLKLISDEANLKETYTSILDNQESLYITDYGIDHETLNKIKSQFDLTYDALACNEQCNFYSVKTNKPKISNIPETINGTKFDLDKLSKEYTFSIFNSRFTANGNPFQNTKTLTTNLNFAGFNQKLATKNQEDFMIFSGNPIYKSDKSWSQYFDQNFAQYNNYPILYSQTEYHKFFSQHDYYIFLNLDENSKIDTKQKIFVYNAFLELEKLPEIKNIFVIAHNLNWQNNNNNQADNFINDLGEKLSDFPNLNKYIITKNYNEYDKNKLNEDYKFDAQTNTHYFAYKENIKGYAVDYIQFRVDQDSKVSFEKIKFTP